MGKRRPSRGLASSKKPTGSHRRAKPKLPQNAVLRELWDPKRTITENYDALGIHIDPDRPVQNKGKCEFLDRVIGEGDFVKTEDRLKGWEKTIVQKLTVKYGTDYKAMSKDIKLNVYQWTTKQLQRMHESLQAS